MVPECVYQIPAVHYLEFIALLLIKLCRACHYICYDFEGTLYIHLHTYIFMQWIFKESRKITKLMRLCQLGQAGLCSRTHVETGGLNY